MRKQSHDFKPIRCIWSLFLVGQAGVRLDSRRTLVCLGDDLVDPLDDRPQGPLVQAA